MSTRFTAALSAAALALLLGLAGCGGNSSATSEVTSAEAEPEPAEQEETAEEVLGTWYVGQQKDDFGDIVEDGDEYLYQYFTGEFSNTATSGSELTGMMLAKWDNDLQDYFMMFSLHEYNNAAATYTSRDSITLKTKDSKGTVRDYELIGTPPNGYIGTSGTQFLEDLSSEPDKIRCIINIGSSRYEFSISSEGFEEAVGEYAGNINAKLDIINSHSTEEALKNIMPGDDPQRQFFAAQFLTSHASDCKELDQSEQEGLVPGTYAWIGFSTLDPDSTDVNYVIIYRYDEDTYRVLGYIGRTGAYKNAEPHDATEYHREDGSILWPDFHSNRVMKIADGYYLLQDGKYYYKDTGLIDGGLMFECDEEGNPTKPLS